LISSSRYAPNAGCSSAKCARIVALSAILGWQSYGEVEDPTVESLKSQLDKTGRAVLSINFDFNKATLWPDAKPIIAQVVKLMTDDPRLTLAINGHTDNVGQHDYNVKLSQSREAAVVDALVAANIAPARLSSGGFGPDQPVDDNGTEKGRAKNRGVEIVRQQRGSARWMPRPYACAPRRSAPRHA
jgi:outer membrane protein OmpA-like peptidoglycan-associated protein